jgi:hypothetical protein
MQTWILLGILVIAEVVVFPRIPAALLSGEVSLNPLGWFGYGELQEISIDRRVYPVAYWMNIALLTVLAALVGLFIYAVLFRAVS